MNLGLSRLAGADVEQRPGGSAPILADTLAATNGLCGGLRVETRPRDRDGWIAVAALADPETGPLADLIRRFGAAGFGANRKAAAGSLLLRYGWASGFAIASYLACDRVALIDDFALKFSQSTLIEGIWIREAYFLGLDGDRMADAPDWAGAVPRDALRQELLASLIDFTEPLIDRQHIWSGFSRHALWAMVVSSWAAQFASVGERLGRSAWALEEARAVLALDPEIERAAPQIYEVRVGANSKACQKRAACCLYFKGPRRHFCASCPIIPEAERLERNSEWVRSHPPETRQAAG